MRRPLHRPPHRPIPALLRHLQHAVLCLALLVPLLLQVMLLFMMQQYKLIQQPHLL